MKKLVAIIGKVIILGILLIFLVSATKNEPRLDDFGPGQFSLVTSQAKLSACNNFTNKLLTNIDVYTKKISECKGSLDSMSANLNLVNYKLEFSTKFLTDDLDKKNIELVELKKELQILKGDKDDKIKNLKLEYSSLAQNMANNRCCKAQVDNPKIEYYTIESNRVICLEEGTLKISC